MLLSPQMIRSGLTPPREPPLLRDAVRVSEASTRWTALATVPGCTSATVTCPAGLSRPITARRYATFGAACRSCPLRPRCTAAKDGRTLRLHPQDAILRAARASWAAQPALREDYRKYRPNIERVISQVASRGGRRLKLRYRGTARNNAWLSNRTAALNLRNLISRSLARENGAWALA